MENNLGYSEQYRLNYQQAKSLVEVEFQIEKPFIPYAVLALNDDYKTLLNGKEINVGKDLSALLNQYIQAGTNLPLLSIFDLTDFILPAGVYRPNKLYNDNKGVKASYSMSATSIFGDADYTAIANGSVVDIILDMSGSGLGLITVSTFTKTALINSIEKLNQAIWEGWNFASGFIRFGYVSGIEYPAGSTYADFSSDIDNTQNFTVKAPVGAVYNGSIFDFWDDGVITSVSGTDSFHGGVNGGTQLYILLFLTEL